MTTAQRNRSLTDEQVEQILLSTRTINALAREYGVSRQTISYIRSGANYRHVRPDIPRGFSSRRCSSCVHARYAHVAVESGRMAPRWRCGLGLPDLEEEGLRFAAECSAYAERR